MLRRDTIDGHLSSIAFDFFYWFSRFEFALKENAYLRDPTIGVSAEPGWGDFVAEWHAGYVPSKAAQELMRAPPQRQIVAENKRVAWKSVGIEDCRSDLEIVVRLLKTVRNNLFHGGKHGSDDWDNPKRTRLLLSSGKSVLDELAAFSDLESDYRRLY
jgi:hypothetical protein